MSSDTAICDQTKSMNKDKESSTSSSSSSSDSEENYEELLTDRVDGLFNEFENMAEPEEERESVLIGCPIARKYLYYGAIALPWALFLLERLDVGACPWLNSTFGW